MEPTLTGSLNRKPWAELDDNAKIERLREVIKSQEETLNKQVEWMNQRMVEIERRLWKLENPDHEKKAYI